MEICCRGYPHEDQAGNKLGEILTRERKMCYKILAKQTISTNYLDILRFDEIFSVISGGYSFFPENSI